MNERFDALANGQQSGTAGSPRTPPEGSAHTPGNWDALGTMRTHNSPHRFWETYCVVDGVGIVATGHGESLDESAANARLIAAAPDLLAALKLAEDYMHLWMTNNTGARELADLERIEAAIAKAEGR